MPHDPYEDFAPRYNLFYEDPETPDPLQARFLRDLFAAHGVRRVLDCACGTGRDLVLLKSLGLEVCGSDVSPAMLSAAQAVLDAKGLEIPLQRADFRELERHFKPIFEAVVCLSSSLPHLMEEDDILRALVSMLAVMRDGGVLVLSQGVCDRQWREKPRVIPALILHDRSRIFVVDYLDRAMRVHVVDIHHGDDPAGRRLEVASFDYRALLQDDYARLLARAGFRDVSFFGGWDGAPYDRSLSGRLIVTARK